MPRGIITGNEEMTQASIEGIKEGRKRSNWTIVKRVLIAMVVWTVLDTATVLFHYVQSKKVSASPFDPEQQPSDHIPSDAK
jgi:hypothetical protein